ncbi:MAG: trimethylamine methyltransferase family protein, partial [Alphaproteobacteria bacterium]
RDIIEMGNQIAKRAGGRQGRRLRRMRPSEAVVGPGLPGGVYKPLSDHDVVRIHETALDLLEQVGMGNPLPVLKEHALAKGCWIDDYNRLRFPRALVEDVVAATPRTFMTHGRDPKYDQENAAGRVHFGPGGDSVSVLDVDGHRYRPSTIIDVYDFARLIDRLEHVHDFSQVVIATDIADLHDADINMAYAAMAGTTKHIVLSPNNARHMDDLIHLMDLVLGGEGKHKERPFCSAGGCCVVSPLAYGDDNSEICLAATRTGAPVWAVMAPQAGATAPAALAGTLAQVTAESLAALLLVQLVVPGHPMAFGPWPFVSDLRTGAFTGGGGEQAVLAAAAAQIGLFYGLPTSVGAGMSDAKWPDAQMGFEKGMTITAAALAGAKVSEACGMMASLMGCSFEAMAIDNDMLGTIQRMLKGVEVNDETLSFEVIKDVVRGPGHYLGHPQTLSLMETEYLYPKLADRTSQAEWQDAGSTDILEAARAYVSEILSTHYPTYIDPAIDAKIREHFEVYRPEAAMRHGNGRW